MLESAYEACLAFEFADRQLPFQRQLGLPFTYRGRRVPTGFRLDFLVDRSVVVEVKAVECVDRVHLAQVRSYLQQTGCKVGLLINFNVNWLVKNGITRVVNHFPE